MHTVIVTKDLIDVENYISGQEFFLNMLIRVLLKHGINLEITSMDKLIKSRECHISNSMHLYYTGFKDILMIRKICKDVRIVYHVYHIEDVSWRKLHELSWKVFLITIQPLIHAYLATSKNIYKWLKHKTFLAKSILVEPYYECSCNTFHSSKYIDAIYEKHHDHEVKILYIGRLSPYRSPPQMLLEVARGINKKLRRPVELTIVTKSKNLPTRITLKSIDLKVNLINERIEDHERCELYRKSHFFIYFAPWGNVAMNPPITVLEAVYHGVIPIVSRNLLKDLEIPTIFVADSVEEISNKIKLLYYDLERTLRYIMILKKLFKRFFDETRFFRALKSVI